MTPKVGDLINVTEKNPQTMRNRRVKGEIVEIREDMNSPKHIKVYVKMPRGYTTVIHMDK